METIVVRSHPSLALIKYWGKEDVKKNIPATSSLAVNLESFYTETRVTLNDSEDSVSINGKNAFIERYQGFFNQIREKFGSTKKFEAVSHSNFPVSAGLASSSSGFAALAYGCAKLIDPNCSIKTISDFARQGSASAARAVFDGVTALKRGQRIAEPLFPADHWPELCVIIAIVNGQQKAIPSREAMERCRKTSPYYNGWLEDSEQVFRQAITACAERDLEKLGRLMRQSYLAMFSTMFTSQPPIFYWASESVALIQTCEKFRQQGFPLWETMDAGPQVKMITLTSEVKKMISQLQLEHPDTTFIVSRQGKGTHPINENSYSRKLTPSW